MMSHGTHMILMEQIPAGRREQFVRYYVSLEAERVEFEYTRGATVSLPFDQVAALFAARRPGTTRADVLAQFDAEWRWHVKADGTPPPLGGWTTETMPGRGGRR